MFPARRICVRNITGSLDELIGARHQGEREKADPYDLFHAIIPSSGPLTDEKKGLIDYLLSGMVPN